MTDITQTYKNSNGTLVVARMETDAKSGATLTWSSNTYPLPDVITTVSHDKPLQDPTLNAQLDAWVQNLSPAALETLADQMHTGMEKIWADLEPQQRAAFQTVKEVNSIVSTVFA